MDRVIISGIAKPVQYSLTDKITSPSINFAGDFKTTVPPSESSLVASECSPSAVDVLVGKLLGLVSLAQELIIMNNDTCMSLLPDLEALDLRLENLMAEEQSVMLSPSTGASAVKASGIKAPASGKPPKARRSLEPLINSAGIAFVGPHPALELTAAEKRFIVAYNDIYQQHELFKRTHGFERSVSGSVYFTINYIMNMAGQIQDLIKPMVRNLSLLHYYAKKAGLTDEASYFSAQVDRINALSDAHMKIMSTYYYHDPVGSVDKPAEKRDKFVELVNKISRSLRSKLSTELHISLNRTVLFDTLSGYFYAFKKSFQEIGTWTQPRDFADIYSRIRIFKERSGMFFLTGKPGPAAEILAEFFDGVPSVSGEDWIDLNTADRFWLRAAEMFLDERYNILSLYGPVCGKPDKPICDFAWLINSPDFNKITLSKRKEQLRSISLDDIIVTFSKYWQTEHNTFIHAYEALKEFRAKARKQDAVISAAVMSEVVPAQPVWLAESVSSASLSSVGGGSGGSEHGATPVERLQTPKKGSAGIGVALDPSIDVLISAVVTEHVSPEGEEPVYAGVTEKSEISPIRRDRGEFSLEIASPANVLSPARMPPKGLFGAATATPFARERTPAHAVLSVAANEVAQELKALVDARHVTLRRAVASVLVNSENKENIQPKSILVTERELQARVLSLEEELKEMITRNARIKEKFKQLGVVAQGLKDINGREQERSFMLGKQVTLLGSQLAASNAQLKKKEVDFAQALKVLKKASVDIKDLKKQLAESRSEGEQLTAQIAALTEVKDKGVDNALLAAKEAQFVALQAELAQQIQQVGKLQDNFSRLSAEEARAKQDLIFTMQSLSAMELKYTAETGELAQQSAIIVRLEEEIRIFSAAQEETTKKILSLTQEKASIDLLLVTAVAEKQFLLSGKASIEQQLVTAREDFSAQGEQLKTAIRSLAEEKARNERQVQGLSERIALQDKEIATANAAIAEKHAEFAALQERYAQQASDLQGAIAEKAQQAIAVQEARQQSEVISKHLVELANLRSEKEEWITKLADAVNENARSAQKLSENQARCRELEVALCQGEATEQADKALKLQQLLAIKEELAQVLERNSSLTMQIAQLNREMLLSAQKSRDADLVISKLTASVAQADELAAAQQQNVRISAELQAQVAVLRASGADLQRQLSAKEEEFVKLVAVNGLQEKEIASLLQQLHTAVNEKRELSAQLAQAELSSQAQLQAITKQYEQKLATVKSEFAAFSLDKGAAILLLEERVSSLQLSGAEHVRINEELKKEKLALQSSVDGSRERENSLDREIHALKLQQAAALAEATQEAAGLQKAYDEIAQLLQRVTAENASLQFEQQSSVQQEKHLDEVIAGARAHIVAVESSLSAATEALAEANTLRSQEAREYTAQLDEVRQKLSRAQETIVGLNAIIAAQKAEIVQLQQDKEQLLGKMSLAQYDIAAFKRQVEVLAADNEQLQIEISDKRAEVSQIKATLDQTIDNSVILERTIADGRVEVTGLRSNLLRQQEKLQEFIAVNTAINAKLEITEQELARYIALYAATDRDLQRTLAAMQQQKEENHTYLLGLMYKFTAMQTEISSLREENEALKDNIVEAVEDGDAKLRSAGLHGLELLENLGEVRGENNKLQTTVTALQEKIDYINQLMLVEKESVAKWQEDFHFARKGEEEAKAQEIELRSKFLVAHDMAQALKKETGTLTQENETIKDQVSAVQRTVEALRAANMQLERKLRIAEAKVADTTAEKVLGEAQNAQLTQTLRLVRENLEGKKSTIDLINQFLGADIDELHNKIAKLSVVCNIPFTQESNINEVLLLLQEKVLAILADNSSLTDSLSEYVSENERAAVELARKEANIERLHRKIEDKNEALAAEKSNVVALRQDLAAATIASQEKIDELKHKAEDLESIKDKLGHLEIEFAAKTRENQAIQEDLQEKIKRIIELQGNFSAIDAVFKAKSALVTELEENKRLSEEIQRELSVAIQGSQTKEENLTRALLQANARVESLNSDKEDLEIRLSAINHELSSLHQSTQQVKEEDSINAILAFKVQQATLEMAKQTFELKVSEVERKEVEREALSAQTGISLSRELSAARDKYTSEIAALRSYNSSLSHKNAAAINAIAQSKEEHAEHTLALRFQVDTATIALIVPQIDLSVIKQRNAELSGKVYELEQIKEEYLANIFGLKFQLNTAVRAIEAKELELQAVRESLTNAWAHHTQDLLANAQLLDQLNKLEQQLAQEQEAYLGINTDLSAKNAELLATIEEFMLALKTQQAISDLSEARRNIEIEESRVLEGAAISKATAMQGINSELHDKLLSNQASIAEQNQLILDLDTRTQELLALLASEQQAREEERENAALASRMHQTTLDMARQTFAYQAEKHQDTLLREREKLNEHVVAITSSLAMESSAKQQLVAEYTAERVAVENNIARIAAETAITIAGYKEHLSAHDIKARDALSALQQELLATKRENNAVQARIKDLEDANNSLMLSSEERSLQLQQFKEREGVLIAEQAVTAAKMQGLIEDLNGKQAALAAQLNAVGLHLQQTIGEKGRLATKIEDLNKQIVEQQMALEVARKDTERVAILTELTRDLAISKVQACEHALHEKQQEFSQLLEEKNNLDHAFKEEIAAFMFKVKSVTAINIGLQEKLTASSLAAEQGAKLQAELANNLQIAQEELAATTRHRNQLIFDCAQARSDFQGGCEREQLLTAEINMLRGQVADIVHNLEKENEERVTSKMQAFILSGRLEEAMAIKANIEAALFEAKKDMLLHQATLAGLSADNADLKSDVYNKAEEITRLAALNSMLNADLEQRQHDGVFLQGLLRTSQQVITEKARRIDELTAELETKNAVHSDRFELTQEPASLVAGAKPKPGDELASLRSELSAERERNANYQELQRVNLELIAHHRADIAKLEQQNGIIREQASRLGELEASLSGSKAKIVGLDITLQDLQQELTAKKDRAGTLETALAEQQKKAAEMHFKLKRTNEAIRRSEAEYQINLAAERAERLSLSRGLAAAKDNSHAEMAALRSYNSSLASKNAATIIAVKQMQEEHAERTLALRAQLETVTMTIAIKELELQTANEALVVPQVDLLITQQRNAELSAKVYELEQIQEEYLADVLGLKFQRDTAAKATKATELELQVVHESLADALAHGTQGDAANAQLLDKLHKLEKQLAQEKKAYLGINKDLSDKNAALLATIEEFMLALKVQQVTSDLSETRRSVEIEESRALEGAAISQATTMQVMNSELQEKLLRKEASIAEQNKLISVLDTRTQELLVLLEREQQAREEEREHAALAFIIEQSTLDMARQTLELKVAEIAKKAASSQEEFALRSEQERAEAEISWSRKLVAARDNYNSSLASKNAAAIIAAKQNQEEHAEHTLALKVELETTTMALATKELELQAANKALASQQVDFAGQRNANLAAKIKELKQIKEEYAANVLELKFQVNTATLAIKAKELELQTANEALVVPQVDLLVIKQRNAELSAKVYEIEQIKEEYLANVIGLKFQREASALAIAAKERELQVVRESLADLVNAQLLHELEQQLAQEKEAYLRINTDLSDKNAALLATIEEFMLALKVQQATSDFIDYRRNIEIEESRALEGAAMSQATTMQVMNSELQEKLLRKEASIDEQKQLIIDLDARTQELLALLEREQQAREEEREHAALAFGIQQTTLDMARQTLELKVAEIAKEAASSQEEFALRSEQERAEAEISWSRELVFARGNYNAEMAALRSYNSSLASKNAATIIAVKQMQEEHAERTLALKVELEIATMALATKELELQAANEALVVPQVDLLVTQQRNAELSAKVYELEQIKEEYLANVIGLKFQRDTAAKATKATELELQAVHESLADALAHGTQGDAANAQLLDKLHNLEQQLAQEKKAYLGINKDLSVKNAALLATIEEFMLALKVQQATADLSETRRSVEIEESRALEGAAISQATTMQVMNSELQEKLLRKEESIAEQNKLISVLDTRTQELLALLASEQQVREEEREHAALAFSIEQTTLNMARQTLELTVAETESEAERTKKALLALKSEQARMQEGISFLNHTEEDHKQLEIERAEHLRLSRERDDAREHYEREIAALRHDNNSLASKNAVALRAVAQAQEKHAEHTLALRAELETSTMALATKELELQTANAAPAVPKVDFAGQMSLAVVEKAQQTEQEEDVAGALRVELETVRRAISTQGLQLQAEHERLSRDHAAQILVLQGKLTELRQERDSALAVVAAIRSENQILLTTTEETAIALKTQGSTVAMKEEMLVIAESETDKLRDEAVSALQRKEAAHKAITDRLDKKISDLLQQIDVLQVPAAAQSLVLESREESLSGGGRPRSQVRERSDEVATDPHAVSAEPVVSSARLPLPKSAVIPAAKPPTAPDAGGRPVGGALTTAVAGASFRRSSPVDTTVVEKHGVVGGKGGSVTPKYDYVKQKVEHKTIAKSTIDDFIAGIKQKMLASNEITQLLNGRRLIINYRGDLVNNLQLRFVAKQDRGEEQKVIIPDLNITPDQIAFTTGDNIDAAALDTLVAVLLQMVAEDNSRADNITLTGMNNEQATYVFQKLADIGLTVEIEANTKLNQQAIKQIKETVKSSISRTRSPAYGGDMGLGLTSAR